MAEPHRGDTSEFEPSPNCPARLPRLSLPQYRSDTTRMRYELKALVVGAIERGPRQTLKLLRQQAAPPGPIVKVSGLSNVESLCRYYASPEHFIQGVPLLKPPSRFDWLVAVNFSHDEFVSRDGPKVFCSLEPPQNLSARTLRTLAQTPSEQTLLFSAPDPSARLFYPVLTTSKHRFVRRLQRTMHARRRRSVCLINRFTARPELELACQRTRWASAFADQLDIYGHEPHHGLNGWREFPGYRGAAKNKFRVLREYDFTIAFESTDQPGYITEKLIGALLCGTVPLYWGGASYLENCVPTDCMIECREAEPEEILDLISTMPREQLIRLRRAGARFLQSPDADRFTWAFWAKQLLRRLELQADARERRRPPGSRAM